MKIIRKIDKLGRIVIPKDARKTLELELGDKIEISVKNSAIILTKSAKKEN